MGKKQVSHRLPVNFVRRTLADFTNQDIVLGFLRDFLPLQIPPNYQLIADELERRHQFKRARSTVADSGKTHLAHLRAHPQRQPRT